MDAQPHGATLAVLIVAIAGTLIACAVCGALCAYFQAQDRRAERQLLESMRTSTTDELLRRLDDTSVLLSQPWPPSGEQPRRSNRDPR